MYYNKDDRDFLSSIGIENETIIEIGCFAILWGRIEYCFFENFYKSEKLLPFSQKLSKHMDCSKWFSDIINELKNWNSTVSTDELISRLRPCASDNTKLKHILNNTSDNEHQTWACLYICARIRNNMFHGEKDEWKLNSQKKIFMVINNFLTELLKIKQCYNIKIPST